MSTEITSYRIGSYPSIYAIGHANISEIFSSDVIVEEKCDGSQFSMCRTNGELKCRSKGAELIVTAPEKMFTKAVATAESLDLHDGWTYRCEFLQGPRHNTLMYSRVPEKNLIVFDVQTGVETYLGYAEKKAECERIGLECVPLLFQGRVNSIEEFKAFMDRESVLGGTKIEGVVVKNYSVFTKEKKVAIGKFVSEAFKEENSKAWKSSNPGPMDFVETLISRYKTEARWNKSVQHLRDAGQLEGSPRDIGKLITEIPKDILGDSEQEIREALFGHFWPHIKRGVIRGLPEHYKEQLAKSAFNQPGAGVSLLEILGAEQWLGATPYLKSVASDSPGAGEPLK